MTDVLSLNNKPIEFTNTLPGSDLKQSAILGHLLTNCQFFLQAYRKIQPNWFRNSGHAKVYQFLLNLFTKINIYPQVQEFKQSEDFYKCDPRERNALYAVVDGALANSMNIRLEFIKPELTEWLHSKILQEKMLYAAKAWNGGNFKDAAAQLYSAVKEFNETRFEEGSEISFDNPQNYLLQAEEARKEALTTGLTLLDKALLTDRGGLQKGDTTVLVGAVNTGKTSVLLTIARHNILLGKNVLLMTHEGPPADIRLKLLKCVLNVDERTLFNMYKSDAGMKAINIATTMIRNNLVYMPYNKAGMVVEDVVPIIRRLQEERVAKTGRGGFDLLVSDYPAKLSTNLASKGNMAPRHIQDIVYENYVQLALEYNFHSLSAIQTNREGSKLNSGQLHGYENDHRLLQMEDVSEAFGPMQGATNVITLNRSVAAKRANRITFLVAKSRSSETGVAVVAKTNFAHTLTHSNDMGATSYIGTYTMEDKIDQYLINFNGQVVPDDVIVQDSGAI